MVKTIIICMYKTSDSEQTLREIIRYFKSWYGSMFNICENVSGASIAYLNNEVNLYISNCSYASLKGRRCDYYITDDYYPEYYFRWDAEELSVETVKSKVKEILFDRSYADTDTLDYSSIYPVNPNKESINMSHEFIKQLNSIYGIRIDKEKFYKEYMGMIMGKIDIRKEIKRVIFNNPATIVFWADGTKTVVKCGENDIYDTEKGLAMAISKKMLGNTGNFNEVFKKWLPTPIEG